MILKIIFIVRRNLRSAACPRWTTLSKRSQTTAAGSSCSLCGSRRAGSTRSPSPNLVSGTPTDQVTVEYTHVHLPLLEKQGYIRWDRRHHEVTEGPRFDELRPLLDTVEALGEQ